jgi:hypothetical protein
MFNAGELDTVEAQRNQAHVKRCRQLGKALIAYHECAGLAAQQAVSRAHRLTKKLPANTLETRHMNGAIEMDVDVCGELTGEWSFAGGVTAIVYDPWQRPRTTRGSVFEFDVACKADHQHTVCEHLRYMMMERWGATKVSFYLPLEELG